MWFLCHLERASVLVVLCNMDRLRHSFSLIDVDVLVLDLLDVKKQ